MISGSEDAAMVIQVAAMGLLRTVGGVLDGLPGY